MATNMLYTNELGGYTAVATLMKDIVADMVANGFTQIFPASPYDGNGTVILEPTIAVDPLWAEPTPGKNPTSWRIAFTTSGDKVKANVATSVQLMDDGTIAKANIPSEPHNAGNIIGVLDPATPAEADKATFIDRSNLTGIAGAVYPMSYMLSISDHGVFLSVWDQSSDENQSEETVISPAFRWILIQRPVSHTDGSTYVTGRAPVFCVYTVFEGSKNIARLDTDDLGMSDVMARKVDGVYYRDIEVKAQLHRKFVVREADILKPSLPRPADQNVEDSAAILNSNYQVAVSEDNRYIITIPKGLNTMRYAYTHELDMLAYTSADVIGQWNEIDLDVYADADGNKSKYTYKSLLANRIKNTGMRILTRVKKTEVPTEAPVAP